MVKVIHKLLKNNLSYKCFLLIFTSNKFNLTFILNYILFANFLLLYFIFSISSFVNPVASIILDYKIAFSKIRYLQIKKKYAIMNLETYEKDVIFWKN